MSETRCAVLIASGRFPEEQALEDLRCPERDVDALSQVLAAPERGGFSPTHVLKNVPSHEVLLRINQVLREAGKEDLILIYYSGHGKLNAAGKLHLATVNTVVSALEATSIPVGTVRDYIDISAAHRIVLVLDCCFSGAAGPAFVRGDVGDQLQLVSRGRGTYIMTASTGIQVAVEKESDEYGVFTKHFVQGISTGEADLGGDGLIGMDELYTYVHDKVLEEGFQEPMKWDLNVRGELIIARSGRTPREDRIKEIRRRLGYLARRQLLPDQILSQAYDVLRLEPDELTEESRSYYALLEELVQEKMTLGELIGKWYHLGPPAAVRLVDVPVEPAEMVTDEEAKVAEPLPMVSPAREPPREEALTEVKAPAAPAAVLRSLAAHLWPPPRFISKDLAIPAPGARSAGRRWLYALLGAAGVAVVGVALAFVLTFGTGGGPLVVLPNPTPTERPATVSPVSTQPGVTGTAEPPATETPHVLPSPTQPGVNLLANPSFEEGTFGPQGWRTQSPDSVHWPATPAHSGAASLALSTEVKSCDPWEGWGPGAAFQEDIPIDPARRYTLSAWFSGREFFPGSPAVGEVVLYFYDGAGRQLTEPSGGGLVIFRDQELDTSWKLVTLSVGPPGSGSDETWPPEARAIDLGIWAPDFPACQDGAIGTVYVDDVFFGVAE